MPAKVPGVVISATITNVFKNQGWFERVFSLNWFPGTGRNINSQLFAAYFTGPIEFSHTINTSTSHLYTHCPVSYRERSFILSALAQLLDAERHLEFHWITVNRWQKQNAATCVIRFIIRFLDKHTLRHIRCPHYMKTEIICWRSSRIQRTIFTVWFDLLPEETMFSQIPVSDCGRRRPQSMRFFFEYQLSGNRDQWKACPNNESNLSSLGSFRDIPIRISKLMN